MANLHEITAETLTRSLGVDVPEIFVVVAKHSVMGMDSDSIRSVLGCAPEDIAEVESDGTYKLVRHQVAAAYAQNLADQATGWDALENIAVTKLVKKASMENDAEFLLRIAAVANKAQRRMKPDDGVLNPSASSGKVTITLTERLVRKLQHGHEETAERILSISDGSMSRANFEEVNDLLNVRQEPILTKAVEIQTRTPEPDMDEMMDEFDRKYGG